MRTLCETLRYLKAPLITIPVINIYVFSSKIMQKNRDIYPDFFKLFIFL